MGSRGWVLGGFRPVLFALSELRNGVYALGSWRRSIGTADPHRRAARCSSGRVAKTGRPSSAMTVVGATERRGRLPGFRRLATACRLPQAPDVPPRSVSAVSLGADPRRGVADREASSGSWAYFGVVYGGCERQARPRKAFSDGLGPRSGPFRTFFFGTRRVRPACKFILPTLAPEPVPQNPSPRTRAPRTHSQNPFPEPETCLAPAPSRV